MGVWVYMYVCGGLFFMCVWASACVCVYVCVCLPVCLGLCLCVCICVLLCVFEGNEVGQFCVYN